MVLFAWTLEIRPRILLFIDCRLVDFNHPMSRAGSAVQPRTVLLVTGGLEAGGGGTKAQSNIPSAHLAQCVTVWSVYRVDTTLGPITAVC